MDNITGKTVRKVLQELLKEGKHRLEEKDNGHTRADREALEDVLVLAEKALNGKNVPFYRNREFLSPREEESVRFAYQHYTMVPTFFEKGKPYGTYGLKDALQWYDGQDMRQWSREELLWEKTETLRQCEQLMNGAVLGNNVGEYGALEMENLLEQRERLSIAQEKNLVEALKNCLDAMYASRLSRIHRSDLTEHPVLLLPDGTMEMLRQKISQDDLAAGEYEKILQEADKETLEECRIACEQMQEKYTYEHLNQQFLIQGDSGKAVNLITPPKTSQARLSVVLSSQDNEKRGLGHIWIQGMRLRSAEGSEVEFPNVCSLEEKETQGKETGWKAVCVGNAIVRTENVNGLGECLYLCNPDESDVASVVCGKSLHLKENSGYTLFFRAKQDGKLKDGLYVTVEFLDASGKVLDRFIFLYNRKSVIAVGHKALSMQCSAIVYGITRKKEYACKAKYQMLAFLNDFCQGAEYWMVYNERPEGSDAYGAVQAGRIRCSVASTCSLIADAEVMSDEEKCFFYEMAEYLLHYCLDKRDRTRMTPQRVQEGSSNWQTDMCIGVTFLMMALPDFPDRKKWMYQAEAVLKAQLAVNLNRDGSWPESIRYHHASLERFASFARAWKQETGEDWMHTTRLKDMFAYTLHTLTPPYAYFDYHVGTPPFGDHKLGGGMELGIYGLYLDSIAKVDKKLADKLFAAWSMAGYPVKELGRETLSIENLLYVEKEKYSAEKKELSLTSDVGHPDSGIYIFRSYTESGNQNYLAVMAAQKPIGHGHLDMGSFILYHENYPVIMDSGIEGYFDTSTQWHLSSFSHACMQFAATEQDQQQKKSRSGKINLDAGNYSLDRGWLDVPRTCRILFVESGNDTERYCFLCQW